MEEDPFPPDDCHTGTGSWTLDRSYPTSGSWIGATLQLDLGSNIPFNWILDRSSEPFNWILDRRYPASGSWIEAIPFKRILDRSYIPFNWILDGSYSTTGSWIEATGYGTTGPWIQAALQPGPGSKLPYRPRCGDIWLSTWTPVRFKAWDYLSAWTFTVGCRGSDFVCVFSLRKVINIRISVRQTSG